MCSSNDDEDDNKDCQTTKLNDIIYAFNVLWNDFIKFKRAARKEFESSGSFLFLSGDHLFCWW